MINYFEVRQKIATSLKKSGFRVKSPFKVPLGWIDVAVFRGKSVGIDICIENPTSSFKRLLSYPFKRKVILNLTDESLDRKGFIVLNSLDELRDFFKDEFEKDISLEFDFEKKHVEFASYFLNFGNEFELRAILDALVFLYISKDVLEEEAEKYYFKALKAITPKLKEFNLVLSSSKGIKPKYHTMFLSSKGREVARDALIDRIIEKEDLLKSLIKRFGKKIYIIFTAIQRDSHLIYENLKFGNKTDFKSLLLQLKNIDLHSVINRIISYNYNQTPLSIFCYILTYVVLYDLAKEILTLLERAGLASKVPVYSPYGIKVCERFNVPDEVVDFILRISDTTIDNDIVNEIVLLSLLLKIRLDEIEILQNLGIPIEKIENVRTLLENKGLIENGKLRENYESFLKIRIAKACERILS